MQNPQDYPDGEANDEGNIRVLIVDDDGFVRTSLQTILAAQPDIEPCGDGSNGNEARALFEELLPDILLMDIQMPECDGIQAAGDILAAYPDARIVFLTTFSDDEYIVSALRIGAKGYLIKQEVANIAPALRAVMAGQMVLGGEVSGRVDMLMKADGEPRNNGKDYREQAIAQGFSEREFEIVELIAQGLDNKEIAATIFISEGTVRNQVSALLQKLDLKNRTQLAVYYYQNLAGR